MIDKTLYSDKMRREVEFFMGNQCCICQKKIKFLENKMMIAGFDTVCELCLKRAGLYKAVYSFAEIKEFQSVTRREVLNLIQDNDSGISKAYFENGNEMYCSRCHCIVTQMDELCPNCGSRIQQRNECKPSRNYIGQKIKADFNKELELTRTGVRICHKKLQKLIPYDHILDVEFVKASFGSKGYLSIITENDGVVGRFDTLKATDCRVLLLDLNTIMYPKKLNEKAEEIYNSIHALMNSADFEDDVYDVEVRSVKSNAMDSMTGHEFENFCANLLKNNCFSNVKVTKGSGDQGVDVLAEKDGIKYAIQCKLYSTPLGNTPVQEVAAGKTFYGCHVGVVMTNSTFTTGAKELAKATNVLLWDRNKLEELGM